MTEKDKIKQYLDFKGVNKNSFYKKTGLSVGFLDSGNSLGVDKLKIIINNYPDINLEWIVLGRGEMICNIDNAQIINTIIYRDNPDKDEIIALQRKQISLLEEQISDLKKVSAIGSVVSEDYPPAVEIISNVTNNKS